MSDGEWRDLTSDTQDIWNKNARFWDDRMGDEGNDFHSLLIRPAAERLLDIKADETVLDVACGNGIFSRRLAQLGAQVVAIDFSETLIDLAKARSKENSERITYQVMDANDGDQLLSLGAGRFDAAVSNMALMDMATITPLLESLSRLLKPKGRFVFSFSHPCFLPPGMTRVIEEDDREGEIVTRYSIKVSEYITPTAHKGLAIFGQPAAQYYFHRPLSLLFKECFKVGFVLDGLEEPVFELGTGSSRASSWENYKEIPPALVVRMRLLQK